MASMSTGRRVAGASMAALFLAGTLGIIAVRASSAPQLPPVAPSALIASAMRAEARAQPVSGRATATLDLGLPSAVAASSSSDPLSWITGDHHLRVWRSPDGMRVSESLPAAEKAIVAGATGVWGWDSESFTAVRMALPDEAWSAERRWPAALLGDPIALARAALEAVTPSTEVRTARPETVAGRAAYVLVIDPRSDGTLVGRIEVAFDSEHRVPLRFEVFARGAARPALSATFDSVSFDGIDPSVFSFDPPPGATVRQLRAPDHGGMHRRLNSLATAGADAVKVFGRGWSTVIAVRTPANEGTGKEAADLSALLPFYGPLLSVDLVAGEDGGWLVFGAVPRERIEAAAARLR